MVGPIHRDLGLSDTQFGLLYGSAFVVFYSAIGMLLGRLVDVLDRTKVLAASVLIWSLATAACGSRNPSITCCSRALFWVSAKRDWRRQPIL